MKVLSFVEVGNGESRVLSEDIVLYDYAQEDTITGEGIVTTGNLQITASEDGYDPPFGQRRRDAQSHSGRPCCCGSALRYIEGDVVAMWYLARGARSLSLGWGITATGIDAEGDTIQVLFGDYFEQVDIAGEVTAGADGAVTLTNDDCGGVHFLSTLVLVKK